MSGSPPKSPPIPLAHVQRDGEVEVRAEVGSAYIPGDHAIASKKRLLELAMGNRPGGCGLKQSAAYEAVNDMLTQPWIRWRDGVPWTMQTSGGNYIGLVRPAIGKQGRVVGANNPPAVGSRPRGRPLKTSMIADMLDIGDEE